jgi:elongation of very long chain fatty acids protein 6
MNYIVHVFMYTYFALRAMGYRIPKQVAMFVTLLQISQMAAGIVFHVKAYTYLSQNLPCAVSYACVWYAFLLYTSYFFLFVKFFITSYLKSGGKWSVRHMQMHKPMIGKID